MESRLELSFSLCDENRRGREREKNGIHTFSPVNSRRRERKSGVKIVDVTKTEVGKKSEKEDI